MSKTALLGVLWLSGFAGKHLVRPYRVGIFGHEAVGKSTFWKLLKMRALREVHEVARKPTRKPSKKISVRLHHEESAKIKSKYVGWDYPHEPEWITHQFNRTNPSDVFLLLDYDTCVGIFDPPDDDGSVGCNVHPDDDPNVEQIREIVRVITSFEYRKQTAASTIGRFKIRHHRRVTDFHLVFNKVDRARDRWGNMRTAVWVRAILDYYAGFLKWVIEDEEIRFETIATSLTKCGWLRYNNLRGRWMPMKSFFDDLVNIKDS